MSDLQSAVSTGQPTGHASGYMHYFRTWVILLILTAFEVGIVLVSVPRLVMVGGLLLFTVLKAFFIFADFMHLKYERFGLIVLAAAPILFGFIMFIGMLLDF